MNLFKQKKHTVLSKALPLFPLGVPRSGTTFLAKLLDAHPQILMTNETAVFLQLNEIIQKSSIGSKAGIIYGKEYNKLWSDYIKSSAAAMITDFYRKIAQEKGKGELNYWGDKHPHHNHCFDFIAELYPGARYIYIVRHPGDVAISIAKMREIPFSKAIKTWESFSSRYEDILSGMTTEQKYFLRYEDLVMDYEGTTKKMLSWLDLEFSKEISVFLQNYKNVQAHSYKTADKLVHLRRKKQEFANISVGKWMNEISDDDRTLLFELAGGYLRKYSYLE